MTGRAQVQEVVTGGAVDCRRLEQLVLIRAEHLGTQETHGATMLDQALVACEVRHFRDRGRALTGAQPHRRIWGPALPALVTTQRHLLAFEAARLVERSQRSRVGWRVEAVVPGEVAAFSTEELHTVHAVIRDCRHLTARQLSDRTRATPGWRSAREGEAIPLAASLLHEGLVTDGDRRAAHGASPRTREHRRRAPAWSAERGLAGTDAFAADCVATRAGIQRGDDLIRAVLWMIARRGDDPVLCPHVRSGVHVGRAAHPGGRGPLLRVSFRQGTAPHRAVLLAAGVDQRPPPDPLTGPAGPAPAPPTSRQEIH